MRSVVNEVLNYKRYRAAAKHENRLTVGIVLMQPNRDEIFMQSTLRKQRIYAPLYTSAIPRGIPKLSAYLIFMHADVVSY
jgi:hypothetical protein